MTLLKESNSLFDQGERSGGEVLPWGAQDARPTVLIAGAAGRAESIGGWSERAGLRCVGRSALSDVAARLSLMVQVDFLLVDLRGVDVAQELGRTEAQALTARHGLSDTRLIVIADLAGLDCAMAMLDAPHAQFLCEPSDSDIVSLLVIAALSRPAPGRPSFHDASRDTETTRLEKLSDEVRRLAETIESMARGGGGPLPDPTNVRDRRDVYRIDRSEAVDPARLFQPRERQRAAEPASGEPTHAEFRAVIRARRMRDQYLPADLFADPAWDMILDLMAARLAGQRVSVSSLCIAASVPPTTALRWIRQLTDRGVFARIDDPTDGRRVFIELTDSAASAVLGWVQAVRRN
ncbi:MAG: hypothetical protein J0G94_00495, partial [Sphingomonadales bacterium]|nr:hypothetical protein [Sphingomonadales bacterium]